MHMYTHATDTHTADLHMGASTEENLTCVHKPPHSERVIMVTGAAGFIGFHLAQKLREQWPGATVVGLDNFSNYYDVQLKKVCGVFVIHRGRHYNLLKPLELAYQLVLKASPIFPSTDRRLQYRHVHCNDHETVVHTINDYKP